MFETFKNWCNENNTQVTWFLIGLLTADFFNSLSRGEYAWAAFCAVLVVLNYITRKLTY